MSDLVLKNVAIGYGQAICSNINATVKRGELVGLAGKNGAGKSTLIHSILGLQSILSGEILLDNQISKHWSIQKRAQKIAVVFSRLQQVPSISVEDVLALGRLPHQKGIQKLSSTEKELIEDALEKVGIVHLKNKMAHQLSDGQLQMMMIARALVQDTDWVIMDEPTSHLDIENQFKIFELIEKLSRETQKSFLVASHQIDLLLQNATQLWWLDQGKFHAGFPEQIAYEQQIYEQLSQEKIKFNYGLGNFQFQHHQPKTIQFMSDGSDFNYWIKHALERNGFAISTDAPLEVFVTNGQIRCGQQTFDRIEQLIKYLKKEAL